MLYNFNDISTYFSQLDLSCMIFDKDKNLVFADRVNEKLAHEKALLNALDSCSPVIFESDMRRLLARGFKTELGTIAVLVDLTDFHKSMTADAAELSGKYEKILDSLLEGLFIIDAERNVLFVNKTSQEFCGMSKEELMSRKVDELVRNKVFTQSVNLMALESGKVESIIQTTRLGKKLLAKSTPICDEKGTLAGAMSLSYDVTEMLHLRSQLEEQNELIKKITSTIKDLEMEQGQACSRKLLFSGDRMDKINYLINKVSQSDISILLLGESGVGKTVIAKMIHDKSPRSGKPFQVINCSAIPENLMESELFGYEKGSFTGALDKGRQGLFEMTNGGTVFLDEIGELSPAMQVKLLHVLQERRIRRIGGDREIDVDFRLIAATNQDISARIASKQFREDLYYRINGYALPIPPLRERKDDIQLLANYFLRDYNQKNNAKKRFAPAVLSIFAQYGWPGNVRELEHLVECLCVISDYDTITVDDLPDNFSDIKTKMGYVPVVTNDIMPLQKAFDIIEADIVRRAYRKYKNTYKVAEALEISQATAYRKVNKYCSDLI